MMAKALGMHEVWVGGGSNENRNKNVCLAIEKMKVIFHQIRISKIYDTQAVGFDGPPFYNFVVYGQTMLSPSQVYWCLRKVEKDQGRTRGHAKFNNRPIDLDLLMYNDLTLHTACFKLPREEILQEIYVLRPLADLSPDLIHPEEKKSIKHLLQNHVDYKAKIHALNLCDL